MSNPFHGLLQLHVVKDDAWTLPTEFESYLLQVGLGGGFHDLSANEGASREGYFLNNHVFADGLTNGTTVSVDDIDDTIREACFNEQGTETKCS